MPDNNIIEKDLGPVSAWAIAKANGFDGTEAEWEALQANAAQNGSDAEAFAKGTRNGEAVASDDPAYHNNCAYHHAGTSADADTCTTKAAEATAAAATASAAYNVNLLAPNYSAESTYAVGNHVIYNGGYYECISAISTAEAWTAAHWRQLTVGGESADLKSALSDNIDFEIKIIDGEYFAKWIDIVGDNAACRTNYIPVIPGSIIRVCTCSNSNVYEVAFFDASKTFDRTNSILGDRNINTRELTVPSGDFYVMLTCYGSSYKGLLGFASKTTDYSLEYTAGIIGMIKNGECYGITGTGWYYSNPSSGMKVEEDRNGRCTDMLPVYPGQTLKYQTSITNAGYELVYYSEYKLPLQSVSIIGDSSTAVKTVTVPAYARYVQVFSYGNRGAYIKFGAENSDIDCVKYVSMTLTGYRNPQGAIEPDSSGKRTEMVRVEVGSVIEYITSINNAGNKISFFDENGAYIDGVIGGTHNREITFYTVTDERYRYVELSSYGYKGYMIVYKDQGVKGYLDQKNIFNGGYNTFAIFRKFVVCGDSLSVGHIDHGSSHTSPNLDYCWGRFIARDYDSECVNCGKSGVSAETWLTNADCLAKMQASGNKGQAYIIGLGANEQTGNIGSPSTLNDTSTFYGAYKAIYDAIRVVNPTAKIFMLTLPTHWGDEWNAVNEGIRYIAENVGDSATYLIDMDNDYSQYFNEFPLAQTQTTHFLPAGYKMISKIIEYALDNVIIQHPSDFGNVHLIPYDS